MHIISLIIILPVLLIQCFPINSSANHSLTSSISMNSYFKRHFSRHLNLTDDDSLLLSTNQIHTFDLGYNNIKEVSTLTKTRIKILVTVVLMISLIMLIIMIFRFKNACRTEEETDNFHTDIIRNRASQYSEPSSRRGSVGYYTQRYNRTTNHRFDEQLNISLAVKRLTIPAYDPSSKSAAVVFFSTPPADLTDVPDHHHVTSSCDTSNTPNQPLSIDLEANLLKSNSDQCDDQTPLLISELTSTIKDSSTHSTRKYSLNALLPLIRPSASHPLCSSLTSTIAGGIDVGTDKGVDLKSHRRLSLSSALRRTSFAKQPQSFCATIDSTTTNQTASPPPPVLLSDSDTSDRPDYPLRKQHRNKSSSLTPIETSSLRSYPKDFMHKIERFRFIDDSASSTTTVTSPVESLEPVNTHQQSRRLFPSAAEQFNHYVQTKYQTDEDDDDDVNSLIDCLNSDLLTNGCYSDMNILNLHSSTPPILRPQSFQTMPENSFQAITRNQQHGYRQTIPINIPHSVTSFPLSRQRNQVEINGHSRSMEFQSISNRRDLTSTINDTSSSSTTTLTSIRSSTSIEFDDNSKPSGVLVDDDFLPMSSPVDEHFWDMPMKPHYGVNTNECFPNVGSSPDVEVRHFDLQQLNTLSETSCDEDEDDENHLSISSNIPSEIFSIYENKIKELQKPLLIIQSTSSGETLSEQTPSIDSTEQFYINNEPSTNLPNQSLLEKFSSPIRSDFVCETIPSSNQQSEIISEDDTQDSSPNDASEGEESADNGEIDLVREFELSQKEGQIKTNNLWSINDRDVYIIPEDDLISSSDSTPTINNRSQPTSIMKITNIKSTDPIDEQQQQTLKPKVRFNLDPQYEREREWNKVNKLLGNSVEWTDEFEV